MIVASFAHPGQRPHSFRITADHNFRGLFRQVAVDTEPAIVRSVWNEVSDMPLVQITPGDLARRWAAGTGMYRLYLDPPVYDDVPQFVPLLEARATVLPTPPEPEDEPELSEDERRAFIDGFLASPLGPNLASGGDVDVEIVVDYLVDFRDSHGEGDLGRWSPIVVEIAMLDWLPRKASMSDEEVAALPDVLRGLVRFTGGRRRLSDADINETISMIDSLEEQFLSAMADTDSFGPASGSPSRCNATASTSMTPPRFSAGSMTSTGARSRTATPSLGQRLRRAQLRESVAENASPSRGISLAGVPRAVEIEREARRLGLKISVPATAA